MNTQLHQMSGEIKDVVEKLNKAHLANVDEDSPAGIALEILNKHNMSLEWLEQGTAKLGRDIDATSKQINQVYQRKLY